VAPPGESQQPSFSLMRITHNGFVTEQPVTIDFVKVLRPTRHRIGHFGDVLPSQPLGLVLKKLNPTQQKQATQD